MAKKISFFESYFEAVEDLPAEEYKRALNALFEYCFHGIEPQGLTGMAKMFFCMAKPIVDKGEKTSANGKNGGRPSEEKDNQLVSEEKPIGSKKDNQLVSEEKPIGSDAPRNKDKEKDKEQDIKNSPAPSASPSALEREFESIWSEYPRKQERKDAFAAYCSARKRGTTAEQIAQGVRAYCAYIERNHVDQRYVKQGGTFFRQQAWQDDWSGSFQTARSGTPGSGSGQEFPQRTDDLDALALQLQFAASQ